MDPDPDPDPESVFYWHPFILGLFFLDYQLLMNRWQ